MYDCPNCGGNLNFDIVSQKLRCDYCHTELDPHAVEDPGARKASGKPEEYEVTVFTCPNCGGEIASTNISATGFCTYCGSSAVFEKRISGEKRPRKIIPFKKTKEDCKEAYAKALRSHLYAPKELKDPAFLDRFVGLYMPYWNYEVTAGPEVTMKGTKSHSKGNYTYTDHYDLNCSLEKVKEELNYDASSAFDDHIHEAISPYSEEDMTDFTPGYMAGFYADIADVPSEIYRDDAESAVAKSLAAQVRDEFPDYEVEYPETKHAAETAFHMKTRTSRAMLPVWFLTYRKDDRVAYSVVNGQTGKVYADVPVDIRRFFLASLLLAVPFFIGANFLLTITSPWMLTLSAVFAFVTVLLYNAEMKAIRSHETRAKDPGYIAARLPSSSEAKALEKDAYKKINPGEPLPQMIFTFLFCAVFVFLVAADELYFLVYILGEWLNGFHGIILVTVLTGTLICYFSAASSARHFLQKQGHTSNGRTSGSDTGGTNASGNGGSDADRTNASGNGGSDANRTNAPGNDGSEKAEKKLSLFRCAPEALGCVAAVLIAVVIHAVRPPEDMYYYGGAVISYLGIVLTLTGLIRRYNLLATRPIPEFHNRSKRSPGGDGAAPQGGNAGGKASDAPQEEKESKGGTSLMEGNSVNGSAAPQEGNAGGNGSISGSAMKAEKPDILQSAGQGQKAPAKKAGARLAAVCLALAVFLAGTAWAAAAGQDGGSGAGIAAASAKDMMRSVKMSEVSGKGPVRYTNPANGYQVVISDEADLLSDVEELLLVSDMIPVTDFGNVGFASGRSGRTEARWYAEARYQHFFGTKNGTMFVIDMDDRQIRIHSDGSVYKVINDGRANTITDNVYRYASKGYYYSCASKAFEQITAVLNGARIAQPMKYTSNALLALILAVLVNYIMLRVHARRLRPEKIKLPELAVQAVVLAGSTAETFIRQTKKQKESSSGGFFGGSRGGGGFGGGGGHSGGGGGHGF